MLALREDRLTETLVWSLVSQYFFNYKIHRVVILWYRFSRNDVLLSCKFVVQRYSKISDNPPVSLVACCMQNSVRGIAIDIKMY